MSEYPPIELEILHHHAAAIDWLSKELESRVPGSVAEQWKVRAFAYALNHWVLQTPADLKETLDRNTEAVKQAVEQTYGFTQHSAQKQSSEH